MTERLGIYGGTFDPPHLGHLILAETAADSLNLSRVLFVVAGDPPHKDASSVRASAEHRIAMVTLAIADNARFAVSRRLVWRLGLAMLSRGIRKLRRMTDWKQYGGAPLLGLDHVVIKAHGRANPRAVRNAIKLAAKTVERDLIGRISATMKSGR